MEDSQAKRLRAVALLFLKLGTTAFGGPAAHTALMEDEVVRRRKWLTHEEFLDLLGAANLIPGPNSTEMAIYIGHRRAGWAGLVVAGICFIVPAVVMVTAIAWGYVKFGKLPQVEGLRYGAKPVIIAVIAQALWRLGRTAIKTRWLAALGAAGIAMNALGVNELLILFALGLVMAVGRTLANRRPAASSIGLPLLGVIPASTALPSAAAAGLAVAAPFSLLKLFLFFLKVGSVLYGTGYVLLAFLRADLVERWHWLNNGQLLDAIAVGQVTPGPLFTTATFVGYLLGGVKGAALATAGIFLPAFLFVAISGPLVPRLRRSAVAGAFLDGVNVASLALMAVVTWQLGIGTLVDPVTLILALVATFLLVRYKVNSIWMVLAGGLVGLALRAIR